MGRKVVQLVQGERKALELDSVEQALEMFRGFPLLHIIDLDAAKGSGDNLELISSLLARVKARVGGGIRSAQTAKQILDLGAEQIIVGTAAFFHPRLLPALAREIGPKRIIIAADCKNGKVAVKGWQETLDVSFDEAIKAVQPYCSGVLCTYVDREGMMQGTDIDFFLRLRSVVDGVLIAAGGISSIEEVKTLLKANIQVALGMAIYSGRLDLDELRELLKPLPVSPYTS